MKRLIFCCLFLPFVAKASFLSLEEPCVFDENISFENFTGHNSKELLNTLKKSIPPKDKYESKGEYSARVSALIQDLPKAVAKGQLCIVQAYDPRLYNLLDVKYNPEEQKLLIKVIPHKNIYWNGNDSENIYPINVNVEQVLSEKILARNTFGVEFEVEKRETKMIRLALKESGVKTLINTHGLVKDKYGLTNDFIEINIDSAKAREHDEKIRIAYSFSLDAPVLSYDKVYRAAELIAGSTPLEATTYMDLIHANLTAVVIYNKETGEKIYSAVVAKQK